MPVVSRSVRPIKARKWGFVDAVRGVYGGFSVAFFFFFRSLRRMKRKREIIRVLYCNKEDDDDGDEESREIR